MKQVKIFTILSIAAFTFSFTSIDDKCAYSSSKVHYNTATNVMTLEGNASWKSNSIEVEAGTIVYLIDDKKLEIYDLEKVLIPGKVTVPSKFKDTKKYKGILDLNSGNLTFVKR